LKGRGVGGRNGQIHSASRSEKKSTVNLKVRETTLKPIIGLGKLSLALKERKNSKGPHKEKNGAMIPGVFQEKA